MEKLSLAQTLVQKLRTSNTLLTTIESCTGGLIAHLITDISGARQVFWGGRVVYHRSAKLALGVPLELIRESGEVSRETALCLAEKGLLDLENASETQSHSLICVATTGFAEARKENAIPSCGFCWIGMASTRHPSSTFRVDASSKFSRDEIKLEFAKKVLEWLIEIN